MKAVVRNRTLSHCRQTLWRPAKVTEYVLLPAVEGKELYYLCPGCRLFLPREFMRFCDSCGQRLNWDEIGQEEEEICRTPT